MRKSFILGATLALALPLWGRAPLQAPGHSDGSSASTPFRWAPKAAQSQADWHFTAKNKSASFASRTNEASTSSPEVSKAFEPSENISYLDMPDGTTWFVTCNYDKRIIFENEYYTEYDIIGVDATIYNDRYEPMGRIKSAIEKPEGFEKCSAVQFGPAVTKKFFNTDDSYEVMLMANFKPTDAYGATPFTFVYSLKGADRDATAVTTLPGYYTAAVNGASDSWSEDFVLEFFTGETYTEESIIYSFSVYGKASYSNPEAELLKTFDIDMLHVMCDGENEPIPVMVAKRGRDLFVTVAQYEKTFFEEPFNYENDNLSADNHYEIQLWKREGNNELTQVATTSIPCDAPDDGYFMKTYALGMFEGASDISFDHGDGETPAYIITVIDTDINENTYTRFMILDHEGTELASFGEGSEGYLHLYSVPGQPEQIVFLQPSESSIGDFVFVDFPSLEKKAEIPATVMIDDMETLLSLSLDRAAYGSSYRYAIATVHGTELADGSTCHEVAWFDADGSYLRTDRLNAGKNINMINPYVSGRVLNPWLFNTDDSQEYIIFALRRDSADEGAAHTELMVVNQEGETLMQYPFDQLASTISCSIVNTTGIPAIWICYNDFEDRMMHSEFIDLPLNTLPGSGTAADPYQLRTKGDFDLISRNLAASYRFESDIDCRGALMPTVNGVFTGTIDGAGHTLKNFSVEGKGLFSIIGNITSPTRSSIQNLSMRNVAARDAKSVLSAISYNTDIKNVTLTGLRASGETSDFGSLIGNAAMGTVLSECAVKGDINLPEAETGGLVWTLGNDSQILACSFEGAIEGGAQTAGIASNTFATSTISDCHSTATLTAPNTVGGIVAYSARGIIDRCVAEGSITATEPLSRWSEYKGGNVKLIGVGGIVGHLATTPTEYDDQGKPLPLDPNRPAAISNCISALSAINIPDDQDLPLSAHRIAGITSANNDPEILDETYNPQTGDWETTWGNPTPAEDRLVANHAVGMAPVCQVNTTELETATGVEGLSIDEADFHREFLEGLGYGFHGYNAEQPWVMEASMPHLHFEAAAGVYLEFNPGAISISEGATAKVVLELGGIDFESLTIESSDESACMPTPVEFDASGNVIMEISVSKAGTYKITATDGTHTAELLVTGTSGITEMDTPSASLRYDGQTLTAEGEIILYSISGARVMSGNSRIDLTTLPDGIYIAVSGSESLKIRK